MRTENNGIYNKRGKLFVFEGSDGVGKSTIAEKFCENLDKEGNDVLLLNFPGREPSSLGNLIYETHRDANALEIDRLSPMSLQVLQIAVHMDCIERRILPALSNNTTVILDQYWWSDVAYGMAEGIPRNVLLAMIALERAAWGKLKPDRLFLITRDKPFRDDLASNRWSLVCGAYHILVHEEKNNYPIYLVSNTKPLEQVVESITAQLRSGSPRSSKSKSLKQESLTFPFKQEINLKLSWKNPWAPTKTTAVFDTYWRFAAERQTIFFKRLSREKMPWTEDHILRNYKFTNAYRASDRVSQFLIRHVIYEGEQDPREIFFRTLLFKTFNKIETWRLFVDELGEVSWREFDFRLYDRILTKAQNKASIYSAAYIMPSGGRSFGYKVKHRNHIALLQKMMEDSLPDRIVNAKSMQEVFELLRSYPMIGDFLAYQYATDINYSTLTNFTEMSFVMPGPGARDGTRKCFSDFGGLSDVDLIKLMADRQEHEFSRLGIHFKNLWGRPLQLIDCQNLFCEVDKYARIAHPEFKGITGRTRIKQKFRANEEPIEYFYPPKWKINEAIGKDNF